MNHPALAKMLDRYDRRDPGSAQQALREILQEVALLGLWRCKFFEHAAFYGGTALRLLHGLDRFSEDLDFSLLTSRPAFDWAAPLDSIKREIRSFGFDVSVDKIDKKVVTPIQSAFLKVETRRELLRIRVGGSMVGEFPPGRLLTIKLEADTNPPGGFETETRYLAQPIPFAVRVFQLPDLFAGKMHAVLCRGWKSRVKGRDWYDWAWYAGHHPEVHLVHLEKRMVQSGHWPSSRRLDEQAFRRLARERIETVSLTQARREVEPFVKDTGSLSVWSKEFFLDVLQRTKVI
jgi:predicted nucleotidyltransferase component of viral defense system